MQDLKRKAPDSQVEEFSQCSIPSKDSSGEGIIEGSIPSKDSPVEGIIQSRQDMQDRQDRKGKPPDSQVEEFITLQHKIQGQPIGWDHPGQEDGGL